MSPGTAPVLGLAAGENQLLRSPSPSNLCCRCPKQHQSLVLTLWLETILESCLFPGWFSAPLRCQGPLLL